MPPAWWWPVAFVVGMAVGLVQFVAGAYLAVVVMGVKEGEEG